MHSLLGQRRRTAALGKFKSQQVIGPWPVADSLAISAAVGGDVVVVVVGVVVGVVGVV